MSRAVRAKGEELIAMGMGIDGPDVPTTLPDTYGLPEYFISEVVAEIDGPNVRLVCGVRRGGVIHWLYSSVMRADRLILHSRMATAAACQAFTLQQITGGPGH